MTPILAPAMVIMSRLHFALKIGLVGLLFSVPLAVLLVYLHGILHAEIKVAEQEHLGLLQIWPARSLAQAVQEHRAASQTFLNGNTAIKDTLPALASDVDEKLAAVSTADETGCSCLGAADVLSEIKRRWLTLKAENEDYSPGKSLRIHDELLDKILYYIDIKADKSGLTLDPKIDAFYLRDAAISHIPYLADFAGRLGARGASTLRRGFNTAEEDVRLNLMAGSYARELADLQIDFAKVFAANRGLAAVLQDKVNEAHAISQDFLKKDLAPLLSGDMRGQPANVVNHAALVTKIQYDLLDTVMERLDGLLLDRINRLQSNLSLIFGGVGLVVLVVIYLFAGMLFSVLRSLEAIRSGAERLADGDVSKLVDSQSRDELRDVGNAVNRIVQTLRDFTKAQLDMARTHKDDCRNQDMRTNTFPGAYGDMARNLNAIVGYIDEQNKILLQQKTIAEHALKSKSEFLSNMSHELRTPMHAILSFAQFGIRLSSKTETEKELKYFKTIHASGKRLLCLLNDLLDLSKLEAGKMTVKRISGDFMDVIKHVEDELGSLLDERGITLKTEMLSKNAEAVFDKQRMIQVLVNLLSNSIKFSPPGSEIRVTLKDSALPSGADALRCSVSDEGPGIPDGELEAVFENSSKAA